MSDYKFDRPVSLDRFSVIVKFTVIVTCMVVLLLGVFVGNQPAFASGPSTKLTPTSVKKMSHGIKPFYLSSQTTNGTPGATAFGTSLYVGWIGTNNHLNITSSEPNCASDNCFDKPVTTFGDSSDLGQGVSLATYTQPGGSNHVWMAFVGGDSLLHFGYYNGSNTLQDGRYVPNQSSCHQPSIAGFNGRLYIAWMGTDLGNCRGHLNIISTDGTSFSSKTTLTDYAEVAPSIAVYNGNLFVTFTGTNNVVYMGKWNGTNNLNRLNIGLTSQDVTGSTSSRGLFWAAAINTDLASILFNESNNPPNYNPPADVLPVQNGVLFGVSLADFQDGLYLLYVPLSDQAIIINRLQ